MYATTALTSSLVPQDDYYYILTRGSSSGSDVFFFQAEDGIRDLVRSRGLGDVYKRQHVHLPDVAPLHQHERAAVHHLGAGIPDRTGVRTDHDAHLQGQ